MDRRPLASLRVCEAEVDVREEMCWPNVIGGERGWTTKLVKTEATYTCTPTKTTHIITIKLNFIQIIVMNQIELN